MPLIAMSAILDVDGRLCESLFREMTGGERWPLGQPQVCAGRGFPGWEEAVE